MLLKLLFNVLLVKTMTEEMMFSGSLEMNKEPHEDSRESFDVHSQPPPQLHPGLHNNIPRPLPPPNLQPLSQRGLPQVPHLPGKEARPSVIESSQPHIIECT